MYESHFSLTRRPFRALATGPDVFVGPQTAAAMAALKKALAVPDAIVCVTGPVGVGKTTIVRRALDAIGKDRVVVTVGRMQLGHDEVLELLLEELGAEIPPGTVQRFTAFRRLLLQFAEAGRRVFIVVEDLSRIGASALAELEALTASDAGVSDGACIVLMGDIGADAAFVDPTLARLRQRLRLKQSVEPLSASELRGYLKHCFRLAGAEFDAVFEDGSALVLHGLSEGIPRVANNLVESSLISAVENKLNKVNVAQIKLVASEEYGLGGTEGKVTPRAAEPEPEPVAEADDDMPELIQDTLPDLEILAPDLAQPPSPPAAAVRDEPLEAESPAPPTLELEDEETGQATDEVPEWERDPTLAQLRPDLDALEEAMAAEVTEQSDDDDLQEDLPAKPVEAPQVVPEITLDREIQAKVDKATEELKQEEARRAAAAEKEKEESGIDDRPTSEILAEARAKKAEKPADNSIEAQLSGAAPGVRAEPPAPTPEAAVANLHETTDTVTDLPVLKDMTTPSFEPAAHRQTAAAETEASAPNVPELAPEPEAQLAQQPEAPPVAEPEPDPEELEKARKADAELEQIAENLARAKTIDDCDDKMAETLFGEEFSMMAAQVAAMAPTEFSANDADASDEPAAQPETASAPPLAEEFDGAAAVELELEPEAVAVPGNNNTSASQRLATLRELNSGAPAAAPAPEPSALPEAPPAAPSAEPLPQSIEDQINVSMTQTLQVIDVPPPPPAEEDDEPKRGFFSRFKRS